MNTTSIIFKTLSTRKRTIAGVLLAGALCVIAAVLLIGCDILATDSLQGDGGDRSTLTNDVDLDNDGLIEIKTLEDLDYIRHNLAGTSYKPGADADADTRGAPTSRTANCDTATDGVYLCGYELAGSLDFDDPASYRDSSANMTAWTSGTGWTPIGRDFRTQFNAIFDGNGHTITNLRIARQDTTLIGLFGYIGSDGMVRNLTLINAQVDYTGSSSAYVGSLAGRSEGTIVAVIATSADVDGGEGDDAVGGLVGNNLSGTITASYATGMVDGNGGIGGLVGFNNDSGTIAASYATGAVDGGDGDRDNVGGLVGYNFSGTIAASYATGAVDGGDSDRDDVGGLVGNNLSGTITASYATGAVDGGDGNFDDVGGLVGDNSGTIAAQLCHRRGRWRRRR